MKVKLKGEGCVGGRGWLDSMKGGKNEVKIVEEQLWRATPRRRRLVY